MSISIGNPGGGGGGGGLVADAINDGTTTVAPSQNAVFDALALKAPLASPGLTGVPTAPTAAPGTNTTQVATTAFVAAAADATRVRPPGASGQYAVPFSSLVNQGGIASGVAKDIITLNGWFTVPVPITITAIQFRYTGGASSGALIRLGLFSLTAIDGTYTLVSDIGTVSGELAGTYQLTGLSIALPAGNYCGGWVHNTTGSVTPVHRVWTPFGGGSPYQGGEVASQVFYKSATKTFTFGALTNITAPTVNYDTNFPGASTGSPFSFQWTE